MLEFWLVLLYKILYSSIDMSVVSLQSMVLGYIHFFCVYSSIFFSNVCQFSSYVLSLQLITNYSFLVRL